MHDLATVGIVTVSLLLLVLKRERRMSWKWPVTTALACLAAYAAFKAAKLVKLAMLAFAHPPLWDFRAFWMFGQVVASHHNVYDPASYQAYRALLNPTNDFEFNQIAIDIGLPYPPPGVLLVFPLGLIGNFSTGMIVWYAAIFCAIAACIFLLWRLFFASEGIAGLVVAAVLVLAMPATTMNIELAQVQFIALLFLLLFWRERTPWRAGLWLAPLIVLRPFFVLLPIYLIVRRQWSALVSLVASSAVLVAISIPLLGPNGLATYVLHNPTQRYPGSYFMGTQCLYRLLAILNPESQGYFSLAAHPLFDLVACLFIAAAAFVCAVCAEEQRDACLGLLVVVGLWVYPSTSAHYCVLLLPPMCAVWRYRERLGLSASVVIVFFAVQYLIFGMHSDYTGLALGLDLIVFSVLAFRRATPAASFALRAPAASVATSAT